MDINGSLLDSIIDILQHILIKVFVSIYSLQIFLELLFKKKTMQLAEQLTFESQQKCHSNTSHGDVTPYYFQSALSKHQSLYLNNPFQASDQQLKGLRVEAQLLCVT